MDQQRSRHTQRYRDARSLLAIASSYAALTKDPHVFPPSLEEVNKWLDLDSDLCLIKEHQKHGTPDVIINHITLLVKASIAANALLTFIALVEKSTSVGKALKWAPTWASEYRAKLRPERRQRAEQALRFLYEFTDDHAPLLEKVLHAK